MSFAPENIHPDSWPKVHAILRPALDRAGTSSSELIDQLLNHSAQLWVKREPEGGDPIAAAVSELVPGTGGPVVHGRLLAGRGATAMIEEAIECVKHHARRVGAVGIRIEGRAGWERILSSRGWKRKAVVMELAFDREAVNG